MSDINKKAPPVYNSVEELIGGTPLVKLRGSMAKFPVGRDLAAEVPTLKAGTFHSVKSELFAKVEFVNPGGSIKDRISVTMINGAERKGLLKPGGTIVEATSGNTGAGLAVVAASRGYKCIFVMPDKIAAEKINSLRAFGAKVIIVPSKVGPEHPDYYVNTAKRIHDETPNSYLTNQYFNPDNPQAHFEGTGPEIWDQMEGNVDAVFIGAGTGGTLSGIARFLKQQNPNVKVVAIDPLGSIYASLIRTGKMGASAPYLVEGVGEDMLPGTMDVKMADDVVTVHDDEAFAATRMLAQREGLLVGGSCGAAFFGATQWLLKHESRGAKPLRAVVLLPDGGKGYLTKVFNEGWLKTNNVLTHWLDEPLGGEVEYLPAAKRVEGV